MLKKFMTAAVATAVLATGFATPASAGPEDGEGCVGFPGVPAAYVCVISVTPGGVVPTTTTSSIPVTVPEFCYAVDCIGPTTVNVPVPGVQPGSGLVATVWYNGQYIPIAVGQVPSVGLPPVSADRDELLRYVSDTTPDVVWEVSWIPILLVFGSHSAWYDFWCGTDITC